MTFQIPAYPRIVSSSSRSWNLSTSWKR